MKIAYFAQINLYKNNGVINKIRNQVEAWQSMGHEVRLIIMTGDSEVDLDSTSFSSLAKSGMVELYKVKSLGLIPTDVIGYWLGLPSSFKKARKVLDDYHPDVVYARYSMFQPFYRRIGEKFKLIVEINTDFASEYYLIRKENLKRYLRFLYFKCTDSLFLKSVSGVVAVTTEIAQKYKGLPVAVVPNSLKVSNYELSEVPVGSKKTSIVFLGTPGMAWHGIDILRDLAKELPLVDFNLIGYKEGDVKDVSPNVILHGFLDKEDYMKILLNSSAALGSLALFRNRMEEACPLKVREYIACCLPLILPYKDTAFEINGYPEWVLNVDFQNYSIAENASKIEKFLMQCATFNIKQEDVLQYIDVSFLEKRRLDFFLKTK